MTQKAHEYKIVLLGAAAVGKSSIVERILRDRFIEDRASTIGAAFAQVKLVVEGVDIVCQVWDTAGQEKFKALAPMYYKDAQACLIVYDVTSRESFEDACGWVAKLDENAQDNPIKILLGNKIDIESKIVEEEELKEYCLSNQCSGFEVSAKTGKNVAEAFNHLGMQLYQSAKTIDDKKNQRQAFRLSQNLDGENKSCC